MEKYIYKITNKINGKIYIGQTNNIKRRWKEHCFAAKNGTDNNYFHNAIAFYGADNFTLEIIEGPIENYDEREQYWINYYNTYNNKEKGYNCTPGGDSLPDIKIGEKSPLSKYSDKIVENIIQDLKNNSLPMEEIYKKYEEKNISKNYILCLNKGTVRPNKNINYPIRRNGNERLEQNKVIKIFKELLYTTLSEEEIAFKNCVDSNTVYIINKGNHFYNPKNFEYPIRIPYKKFSKYILNKIYLDLLNNKLKFSEIEEKYKLSKATINRINQGKICKNNRYHYPLRDSHHRVRN